MRNRLYLDTSCIGGCEDPEFAPWSKQLVEEIARGVYIGVISDLTRRELEDAPQKIRKIIKDIPDEFIEKVFLTPESEELARHYVKNGIVSEKYIADALHVAVASVAKVDVIISWNFKHMVNLERIHAYNSVNLKLGYPLIDIRTPREVLYEKGI